MFRPDGTPAAGLPGAAPSAASETQLQQDTQQQQLLQQHKAAAAGGPVPPVPAWAREPPSPSARSTSPMRRPQWVDTVPKVRDGAVMLCPEG
jgi:hypothetical protein